MITNNSRLTLFFKLKTFNSFIKRTNRKTKIKNKTTIKQQQQQNQITKTKSSSKTLIEHHVINITFLSYGLKSYIIKFNVLNARSLFHDKVIMMNLQDVIGSTNRM